jgi:hypothetical protein
MTAYGGRYEFDGKTVQHHIDISWNEIWTGTTVVRELKKSDKLVCSSPAAPSSGDGGKKWHDPDQHSASRNGHWFRANARTLAMRPSLTVIWAICALVSASARADYQAGTFRCYEPGPDEDKASIWRITVANDNIRRAVR